MKEYEITCRDIVLRKLIDGGYSSYIGTLGVKEPDGSVRHVKSASIMNAIDGSAARYYVQGGGQRAYVETFINDYGDEWLRTVPDNTPLDNLRQLPNCTAASGQVPPETEGDGGGIDQEGGDVDPGGGGGGGGGDDG